MSVINPEIDSLPALILLDWDGTLVDSYDFVKGAHNHVRQTFGKQPWNDTEFLDVIQRSTREIYGSLYGKNVEEAQKCLRAYIEENHAQSLRPMDGAEDFLALLAEKNIPAGIVSNKRHERLVPDIEALGWGKWITSSVVGAGYAAKDKPAPDPILAALAMAGYDGDLKSIWFAGDMKADLEAAQAAGVSEILMLHGTGDISLAEIHQPAFVFSDLRALTKAIDG
jgi:phosphoglycolate phosphatase